MQHFLRRHIEMANSSGQPILILKEGTTRSRGREAQGSNIEAALIITELVKSSFGPKGMDKMLVSGIGDITITNDGATILDEIDVQHPAAKMMVEVAKTQDDVVGDGTTTAVILAGELLKKAEELIDKNIHPSIIVGGYRRASDKILGELKELGVKVDLKDRKTMKNVALTSMHSKSIGAAKDHFADIAIAAINEILEKRGEKIIADIDNIQLVKKEGKSLLETQLVKGVILDKEVISSDMPKSASNAKIALLDCPIEIEKTEFSAEITIKDPTQMKSFLDEESKMLTEMVNKIKTTNANVVICQKGIDDAAQSYLAKSSILAVRRIKKSDMEKLAKATGGRVVNNLSDLKVRDLGFAALVEERKVGEDKMVFVEGCRDPKSVAILIRANLERMVNEAERTMVDALSVLSDLAEENVIVAGGGAIESELSRRLKSEASKIGGREQLAMEAFAEALEVVPVTLAENAGLEPIDVIVTLRSAHEKTEGVWMGIELPSGKAADMMKAGVIEPIQVKEQAVKSATEAACLILRIDDVIAGRPPGDSGKAGMPGGGMPSM
jgi:archaeal chaperonin